MTTIYQVGPDAAYDEGQVQDERFEWVVYWYEDGGYDGSGNAVGYNKDDQCLYSYDMGHCSCYGPFDSWGSNQTKVTVEEFFRDKDCIFDPDYKDEVVKKVAELLPWAVPQGKVFKDKFDLLGNME